MAAVQTLVYIYIVNIACAALQEGHWEGFIPRRGTSAPRRGILVFSSEMALAIGHMVMFHINRESNAFDNPML